MAEPTRRLTRQRKPPAFLISEVGQKKRKGEEELEHSDDEPDAADHFPSDGEEDEVPGRKGRQRKATGKAAVTKGKAARASRTLAFFRHAQAHEGAALAVAEVQEAELPIVRFEDRPAAVRPPITGTNMPQLFPASQRIKCAPLLPHACPHAA